MRTTQRDSQGIVTFSAFVPDLSSSSGVAHPGPVPFTSVRTATGNYTVRFDVSLVPTAITFGAVNGHILRTSSSGAGFVLVIGETTPGTPANQGFMFTMTARKVS
jgi:hypothetical protein